MRHEMIPVIDIYTLEEKMKEQFPEHNWEELASQIYGDEYNNYSCKYFNYKGMEVYTGKSWQDEERIKFMNRIKTVLQDEFPNHYCVLIDVSW